MVAAGTAIATRSAAEKAITSCDIVAIQSTEYTEEEARKLKRSLVAAAKGVPTTVGGGAHGHVYLLESAAEYAKRVAAGYTEAPAPTGVIYTDGDTGAALAQEKEDAVAKAETYHTQEGSRMGLRKAILANVPRETIIELVDPESEFDEVEPRELLAVILRDADPATVVEAKELKQARDAPLTFDGPETLKVQFNLRKKVILDLERLHQVKTSWSEMMMEWLLALEKEEEFEDEVAEWREKTTANGHVQFITFFQDRDRVVRRLAKLKPAKAKDVGFHSAAQVSEDMEARLEQKMEADIAALAIAVEDSINLAMGEATKTPTPPAAAPTRSTATPAADGGTAAVLAALAAITERLEKLEKQGGRRRDRRNGGGGAGGGTGGGGTGGTGGDGSSAAAGERKPCRHCGKIHRIPEAQCWTLDANAHRRPPNYVAPPPGFGGKK
jgi:hypothetical protein